MKPTLASRLVAATGIAALAFLVLPLLIVVPMSFSSARSLSFPPPGFSLRWYQALGQDTRLVEGFLLSLNVAFLSATLATVLATLAAYALIRFGAFKGRSLFNAMLSSPLVMPEVIIGLSLLLLFVGMERWVGWPERGATTIVLGAIFMGLQVAEYSHAYKDLNLKLTSGIFGSTFFLLTGFHGFHVTIGALMLAVVLFRVIKGHFTPDHHFAFEGAAWYWHFVDVVWLGLYIIVYWL
jgi:heme/copper-type cytochrome/quinol oxidase subunit 3